MGRFYLDHRYSEDLDLFVNRSPDFATSVGSIRDVLIKKFNIPIDKIALYPDFVRVWVPGIEDLKIEMVNDVVYRWGSPKFAGTIPVDTVGNILANKLTAIVSRDEPKDVFDIITIAMNFSFNWDEVFGHTLQKAIISEQDILMRINTFPVELFEGKDWLKSPVDLPDFQEKLNRISDDFLLAKDNSLGTGKVPIGEAKPVMKVM